jgi:phage/plasmid-associated DNA primase
MIQMAKDGRLINWALRGLRDLRQVGMFTIPNRSRIIIDQIRGVNSQIRVFVSEVCELDEDAQVQCTLLYKVWVAWCEEQRLRPGSRDQFGRRLINAFEGISRKQVRLKGNKGRQYVYTGIKLNEDALDEYLD